MVGFDRGQMLLYQEHNLSFVTAIFQIYPAQIDYDDEIYFINVFDIFSGLVYSMVSDQFTKIV